MLREQVWFDFCDDLPIEIEQRIDEGILEAERFKERAEQVKEMPRGAARTAAGAELLEQLCAFENPQDKDEPSDLPGIKAASVGEPKEKAEADCDKIYGAWLGRCAGCLLGQPVEGWRRARINGLLKNTTCATTDTPTARKKPGGSTTSLTCRRTMTRTTRSSR